MKTKTKKLVSGRLLLIKEKLNELEERGVFVPAALSVAVEDIEEGLKRLLAFVQTVLDANSDPELFELWDEARGWLAIHEDYD